MKALSNNKKVLFFGLLGAAGCLAGWVVGEGFLWAALPSGPTQQAVPSLVSKPEAPAPPPTTAAGVPVPLVPTLPTPPPPPPLPREFQERLDKAGGKLGDPHLTLIWHNRNDLDLHCIDPQNNRIYFDNKRSPSGGELDVDMNATFSVNTDRPVENIYWPPGRAPVGKYQVIVHHYANKGGTDPTPYTVNVNVGGVRREFTGQISRGDRSHIVHEFEVRPALRLAVPPEMAVLQGGTNRMIVKIVRNSFAELVTVKLAGDLEGLTCPEVVIPAGQAEGTVEVAAGLTARGGARELRVLAASGTVTAEAPLKLTVQTLTPALRLSLPGELSLAPGGKNPMLVRLARDHFTGPVTLRWEGNVEGLDFPETTVPADKTEAEIGAAAARAAQAGGRDLKLVATSGAVRAEGTLRVQVEKPPAPQWSWTMVLVIGFWTALLAVGLALALAMGQNRSLARPLLPARQAGLLTGGGLGAGLVAGGFGQAFFGLLAQANLLPQLGFLIGWLMLGGLLGRGVGFFIPNLNATRATLAGVVGGLLGGAAFILVSTVGDMAGRFLGASFLGFAIGLMVALVEVAFRKAWLEIVYGPNEVGTVNLGDAPVGVGGDSRACTVWARGAAPVALRYQLRGGKVLCEDVERGQSSFVPAGHRQKVGNLEVIVRGSADTSAEAGGAVPTAAAPDKPVTPVLSPDRSYGPAHTVPPTVPSAAAPRPVSSARGAAAPDKPAPPKPVGGADSCPTCGRKAPGAPGQRFCMICDKAF